MEITVRIADDLYADWHNKLDRLLHRGLDDNTFVIVDVADDRTQDDCTEDDYTEE